MPIKLARSRAPIFSKSSLDLADLCARDLWRGKVYSSNALQVSDEPDEFDAPDDDDDIVVSTGNSYVSGNAISFEGIQFNITGSPAAGDTFTVNSSANQSLFKIIDDLITTLTAPVVTPADNAKLANGVSAALQGLDNSFNHILINRSSIGSRQQEVDTLQSIGADLISVRT